MAGCLFVYYSWMNRKAMARGCKWKGYLCYEAGKAATMYGLASICAMKQ